ncbi:MAG TPA: endonuclease/exonuclease/phosphatase family protein [Tepidisphaeraceae bacterium]|nr:endonuclease/exonuclease/phosphatase family protein [Tepidisphaeraceae bacterium]
MWQRTRQAPPAQQEAPPPPRSVRRRLGTAVARVSWTYLLVLFAFWAAMRWAGDRWWLGTLILFGPVWVTALPLAVLVPAALVLRRRMVGVLAIAACVAFFLVMDLCVPWRVLIHGGGGASPRLRLLTCNVHGHAVRDDALLGMISDAAPDIVVLQEWWWNREPPPLQGGKWYVRRDGELLIASRYPIILAHNYAGLDEGGTGGSAVRYAIAAPGGALNLFNLHLASPHNPFDKIIQGKPTAEEELGQHIAVRAWQSQLLSDAAANTGGAVLLAGDFNTPAEGTIYHGYWSQFTDAFSTAGSGFGHTYFGQGAAVRIDHILMNNAWRCTSSRVLDGIGSPHHPLVADLERVGAGQ